MGYSGDYLDLLEAASMASAAGYGRIRYAAFPMRLPGSKRRALRRYALDLPQRLVRAFGLVSVLREEQIREVIASWDMESPWEPYAYALLLDATAFAESRSAATSPISYDSMRREMLKILRLGAEADLEAVVLASYRMHNLGNARVEGQFKGFVWVVGLVLLALLGVWLFELLNAA